MDTLVECKQYKEFNGSSITALTICDRFMAASKVLGEETVSGANGASGQNADGRTGGK